MIAFSIGLGLILATFNIVLPDIDQLTGMILRYAVFFSYAFFPLPDLPWVRAFNLWNLPAIFIINIREILVLGTCSQPGLFAAACGIGLFVFALGIRTFFRLEPRIIERL
jgi:ABC-type polysaccharide/polyol phosphate export permease